MLRPLSEGIDVVLERLDHGPAAPAHHACHRDGQGLKPWRQVSTHTYFAGRSVNWYADGVLHHVSWCRLVLF